MTYDEDLGHTVGRFFLNGRLVWIKTSGRIPPRLLGEGCGCHRDKDPMGGWTLWPCDRHGLELTEHPDRAG
jgi:hypothetical protein